MDNAKAVTIRVDERLSPPSREEVKRGALIWVYDTAGKDQLLAAPAIITRTHGHGGAQVKLTVTGQRMGIHRQRYALRDPEHLTHPRRARPDNVRPGEPLTHRPFAGVTPAPERPVTAPLRTAPVVAAPTAPAPVETAPTAPPRANGTMPAPEPTPDPGETMTDSARPTFKHHRGMTVHETAVYIGLSKGGTNAAMYAYMLVQEGNAIEYRTMLRLIDGAWGHVEARKRPDVDQITPVLVLRSLNDYPGLLHPDLEEKLADAFLNLKVEIENATNEKMRKDLQKALHEKINHLTEDQLMKLLEKL